MNVAGSCLRNQLEDLQLVDERRIQRGEMPLYRATAMGAFAAIFGYVTDLAVRRQMDDGRDGRCEEDVGEREGVGFDSRERRVGTRATDAATRVAMGLNLGAGVLAVAVGTLWLTLSGLGLLGSL